MVVGKSLGDFHHGPELSHAFLEALRPGNAAHRADMPALEVIERKFFAGAQVLPVPRGMAAFDDGSGAVELAQAREEGLVRFRSAFGDDDVGCAAQIGRGLAQRSAGQKVFVAER